VNAHLARVSSALVLSALAGCSEPAADVAHPRGYEEDHLAFNYPGNWHVTSSREGTVRRVEVESPGSAMMEIIESKPAIDMDSARYGKTMMDAMQKELAHRIYGAVRFTPVTTTITMHPFYATTTATR
jgi:hypothetical protein